MSNIPLARTIIRGLLKRRLGAETKKALNIALANMTREPPIRYSRNPNGKQYITRAQKALVKQLAKRRDLTQHDIAVKTGVRNAGRVSEILHGGRR